MEAPRSSYPLATGCCRPACATQHSFHSSLSYASRMVEDFCPPDFAIWDHHFRPDPASRATTRARFTKTRGKTDIWLGSVGFGNASRSRGVQKCITFEEKRAVTMLVDGICSVDHPKNQSQDWSWLPLRKAERSQLSQVQSQGWPLVSSLEERRWPKLKRNTKQQTTKSNKKSWTLVRRKRKKRGRKRPPHNRNNKRQPQNT